MRDISQSDDKNMLPARAAKPVPQMRFLSSPKEATARMRDTETCKCRMSQSKAPCRIRLQQQPISSLRPPASTDGRKLHGRSGIRSYSCPPQPDLRYVCPAAFHIRGDIAGI